MNADQMTLERRVRTLSALADPIRLAVVDALVSGDRSPSELVSELGVPGNLLAHHVNVLERAGVVERIPSEGDRRRTYLHVRVSALRSVTSVPPAVIPRRVVFVCTQNSARSQLAGAVWKSCSDIPTTSAGTHPARRVHPGAVAVAKRRGLRIQQSHPRSVTDVVTPSDFIVTVCDSAHEELAAAGQRHVHWAVPDPVPLGTDEAFDHAFLDVERRVRDLADHVQHSEEESP